MGTRIRYDTEPEYVRPKLEDLDVAAIDYSAIVGVPDIKQDTLPSGESGGESPAKKEGAGYSWNAWGLNIDLGGIEELAEALTKFLAVVDKVNKILTAFVKLLRLFSSDFKSIARLLKVLLKLIVKKIQDLIEGFTSTGIYMSLIFPNFDTRSEKFVMPVNGGYKEFSSTVNRLCLNSKDEDAPKFGSGDVVGGLVLAMIGGTNDPRFLQDLITNFRVLAKIFRFRNPTPSPAKNVTAMAGFYKDPADRKKLKMGIKISWEHPGTPLTGFVLRRSRFRDGSKVVVEDPEGTLAPIRVFKDETFDKKGIKEFNVVVGRPKYHYVDFDVEEGKHYFYKVFTTVGYNFYDKNPFYQKIESPTASKTVYAVPRNKIPLSELVAETTFDVNGNRVYSEEFDSQWQSFSLRTLLGDDIDRLFNQMDRLADKMSGLVSTSSDAVSDYLKFFEKKIKFYMDIVNKIADIITRLCQLKLSGTFLMLWVEPEKGGMQEFVRKYNSATITEDVKGLQVGAGKKGDNSWDFKAMMERGIMAGVILVYGFPQLDGDYAGNLVPEEEKEQFQKSLDKSKKALEAFTSLLGLGG